MTIYCVCKILADCITVCVQYNLKTHDSIVEFTSGKFSVSRMNNTKSMCIINIQNTPNIFHNFKIMKKFGLTSKSCNIYLNLCLLLHEM